MDVDEDSDEGTDKPSAELDDNDPLMTVNLMMMTTKLC